MNTTRQFIPNYRRTNRNPRSGASLSTQQRLLLLFKELLLLLLDLERGAANCPSDLHRGRPRQSQPRRRHLEADARRTRRMESQNGHLHRESRNRAQVNNELIDRLVCFVLLWLQKEYEFDSMNSHKFTTCKF